MRRDIETLMRRIREELRAEGPDGAGYSDFLIMDAMNSAIEDIGEVFPIRDTLDIESVEFTNNYSIHQYAILDILSVEYDGRLLRHIELKEYLNKTINNEGDVREWLLWGSALILTGEIEDEKNIKVWFTRTPKKIEAKGDIPETPSYVDEAIVAYALSVCYRESKDYQRADYHYGIYLRQKDNVLRRSVPQGQRANMPMMTDSYWGPVGSPERFRKTDTNPGGNW